MTTETDVYDVDTSGAVEGYEKVAKASGDVEEKQKSLGQQVDEIGNKFAKQLISVEAYIEMAKELGHWLQESTTKFIEQEQAITRLDGALKLAGHNGESFRGALEEQAHTIERLTGVSEEHTMQVQALLAQFGVAPAMIEKMTDAAYRLANATGQDATMAARLLARANAEGKEELKRFNIEVDDASFKAKGFQAVLDQVDAKFVSLEKSIPESAQRVNALKAAWEDLSKAVGGVIVQSDTFKTKTTEWAASLEMVARLIKGDTIGAAALGSSSNGAFDKLVAIRVKEIETIVEGQKKVNDILAGNGEKPKGVVEMGEPSFPGGALGDPALARQAEEYRKRQEQHQIFLQKQYEDERTARDEEEKAEAEENAKGFVTWKNVEDEHLKTKEAGERALIELSKKWAEEQIHNTEEASRKEIELHKKLAEEVKNIKTTMISDFKHYAEQILATLANVVSQSLLENTKFNKANEELQIQREILASKEMGQNKTRAEIEKQLTEEHQAAVAAQVATTLAGIASEAAIKAIMSGVEAIAAFASGEEEAAAGFAAAAVGYAAVAAAAGGGAAIISSTRGMTTSEREQLENAQKDKASSSERSAQQTAQRGQGTAGTNITVYNLGISGLTEYEQGQELQRIYDKYGDLKTGAK